MAKVASNRWGHLGNYWEAGKRATTLNGASSAGGGVSIKLEQKCLTGGGKLMRTWNSGYAERPLEQCKQKLLPSITEHHWTNVNRHLHLPHLSCPISRIERLGSTQLGLRKVYSDLGWRIQTSKEVTIILASFGNLQWHCYPMIRAIYSNDQ